MTELVNIKNMPKNLKITLVKELGYDSDGKFVFKNGKKVLDKYTEEPIRINNMFIYPGSPNPGTIIILDNNPLSISSFFEERGDDI